jgi:hypothetical protein
LINEAVAVSRCIGRLAGLADCAQVFRTGIPYSFVANLVVGFMISFNLEKCDE